MDLVGTLSAVVRVPLRIAGHGVRAGGRAIEGLLPGDRDGEPPAAGPTVERPPRPVTTEHVETSPPEPAHVDEGAGVVAEFAERGAEEGAGAQVELAEPWEGYDRMQADDVIARLDESSIETLAAVALYERGRDGRTSVLEEAERLLRRRSAPGPRSA
jgi:hypothetical protein